jgi:hypothetical protein
VFTAPASDVERYHYGWSVVSCLPGAMGDPGTAATGAVMRPATLGRYARESRRTDRPPATSGSSRRRYWPDMVNNGLMTAGGSAPRLPARARRAARRFAEVVCPPGLAAHHRTDRVLGELELALAALAPEARKALTITLVVLDQAARLYPRSRGRRFTRLDDQAAEAYIRALLASPSIPAEFVRRLKGLVVMCYYELPPVQREIGYHPAPFIAAVARRRLASYGPEISAGEAAVTEGAGEGGTGR